MHTTKPAIRFVYVRRANPSLGRRTGFLLIPAWCYGPRNQLILMDDGMTVVAPMDVKRMLGKTSAEVG